MIRLVLKNFILPPLPLLLRCRPGIHRSTKHNSAVALARMRHIDQRSHPFYVRKRSLNIFMEVTQPDHRFGGKDVVRRHRDQRIDIMTKVFSERLVSLESRRLMTEQGADTCIYLQLRQLHRRRKQHKSQNDGGPDRPIVLPQGKPLKVATQDADHRHKLVSPNKNGLPDIGRPLP